MTDPEVLATRERILGAIGEGTVCERGGLAAGGSATLAFCPRDGGSEELPGVLGGCPSWASSSAMRAFRALICASSSSIRVSSCCTSGFKLSALAESIFSGAIPSLNQPAALRSIR